MTKKSLSLILLATVVLSACQKKDDEKTGVDENGNCKVDFINSYNDVVRATLKLELSYAPPCDLKSACGDDLYELKKTCQVMSSNYKGVSCQGRMLKDNPKDSKVPVTLAYETLRPNCKTLQTTIAEKPTEQKPFSGKETKVYVAPTVDVEFFVED